MNLFFEESGDFKVGTMMSQAGEAYQVEMASGKRTKVKIKDVLLQYEKPSPTDLMDQAKAVAADIDLDFLWTRSGMHEGSSKGAYVDGLPDGPWHIEEPKQTEDGVYRAGKREGRWSVINYADQDEVTGFDTYAGGQLNGPSERSMGGKLQARDFRGADFVDLHGLFQALDGFGFLDLRDPALLGLGFVRGLGDDPAPESAARGRQVQQGSRRCGDAAGEHRAVAPARREVTRP